MKILSTILFISIFSTLQAREYKAVFDCSSKDARFIMSRMFLVERTIKMIEKHGDSVTFAITLHGGCVPIVSKNYDEVVADEDLEYVQKSQEVIERLSKEDGVEVVACAIALNANTIDEDDVLPFVHISENSFIDTIRYQNSGYALMSFK